MSSSFLAVIATVAFVVGYGIGSAGTSSTWSLVSAAAGSSLSSASSTITHVVDRIETYVASSWWNLYIAIVSSYMTIRLYNLFIDPIFEGIASKLYYSKNNKTAVMKVSPLPRNSTTTTKIVDSVEGSSPKNTTSSRGGIVKDQEPQNQNAHDQKVQPINMTGSYQLISHDNFEAFLGTQGVPRMFQSLACKSKPIHRLVHNENNLSIKVEGIITTNEKYIINGPSIITEIRGKPFQDTMKYLTLEELGLKEPETTEDNSADDDNKGTAATDNDNVNNNANNNGDGNNADDEENLSYEHTSSDYGSIISTTTTDDDRSRSDDGKHHRRHKMSPLKLEKLKNKMKTNFSKGGNLRRSKLTRMIHHKTKSSTMEYDSVNNDSDMETNSIILAAAAATAMNNNNDNEEKKKKKQNNSSIIGTICGIQNIKRQNDEAYTLTVRRRLISSTTTENDDEHDKIEMTLHVEYDDPHTKNVLATQIYERM
mmetsp:Transcript_44440/g.50288  ORF Transcript_44440/g.50288 Transcript_44440/m.50288 type:complete len:482 (+) Transcript_44440:64-1509(+)